MNIFLIVLIVLVISGAAFAFLKMKKGDSGAQYDYKKRPLLSTDEKMMYERLVKVLPNHVVLAQVALNRCVRAKGPSPSPIGQMSVDFIICNKALEIVAAIEIEDKNRTGRDQADQIKEHALDMAGIELIRWPASHLPTEADIASEFRDTLLTVLHRG